MNSRSSDRTLPKSPVPNRIKSLFHCFEGPPAFSAKKLELIHSDPCVYFLKDFLNKGEIDYFDRICTHYAKQFRASFTEDELNSEVISEERTSNYLHLTKSQDRIIRTIEQRAADLVGLNPTCVEPIQIVRYTDGQKFEVHHDAGTLNDDGTISLVNPRRLVTLFIYLNDLPEGEGHTEFPALKISVKPTRGCGVMFANVLPNGNCDARTIHQANSVSRGLYKYGLNIWLCDRDLQDLAQIVPSIQSLKIPAIPEDRSVLTLAQRLTEGYMFDKPPRSNSKMVVSRVSSSLSTVKKGKKRVAVEDSGSTTHCSSGSSSSEDCYWDESELQSGSELSPVKSAVVVTTALTGEKKSNKPKRLANKFEATSVTPALASAAVSDCSTPVKKTRRETRSATPVANGALTTSSLKPSEGDQVKTAPDRVERSQACKERQRQTADTSCTSAPSAASVELSVNACNAQLYANSLDDWKANYSSLFDYQEEEDAPTVEACTCGNEACVLAPSGSTTNAEEFVLDLLTETFATEPSIPEKEEPVEEYVGVLNDDSMEQDEFVGIDNSDSLEDFHPTGISAAALGTSVSGHLACSQNIVVNYVMIPQYSVPMPPSDVIRKLSDSRVGCKDALPRFHQKRKRKLNRDLTSIVSLQSAPIQRMKCPSVVSVSGASDNTDCCTIDSPTHTLGEASVDFLLEDSNEETCSKQQMCAVIETSPVFEEPEPLNQDEIEWLADLLSDKDEILPIADYDDTCDVHYWSTGEENIQEELKHLTATEAVSNDDVEVVISREIDVEQERSDALNECLSSGENASRVAAENEHGATAIYVSTTVQVFKSTLFGSARFRSNSNGSGSDESYSDSDIYDMEELQRHLIRLRKRDRSGGGVVDGMATDDDGDDDDESYWK